AQISAAIQDQEGDTDFLARADDFGWAVQAGVQIDLPSIGTNSNVWALAAYSEGAVNYVSAGNLGRAGQVAAGITAGGSGLGTWVTDQSAGINNEMWAVAAGVQFGLSDNVRLVGTFQYSEFDSAFAGGVGDFDHLFVEGGVIWTPVRNL